MKTLIAEDDFTSRLLLQRLLERHGSCHHATNGQEAVQACRLALEAGQPYDLVCLDIMMPEMDGQAALRAIRQLEEQHGILSSHGSKILMVTALDDMKNVNAAFRSLCDGYLTKPLDPAKLQALLEDLRLLPAAATGV